MKVNCPLKAFQSACESAAPAVAARSTIPTLQCLRLETAGRSLTVQAADGEMSVVVTINDLPVERDGVACVMADQLSGIVRAVDGEEIELNLVRDSLSVDCGTDSFTLGTHDSEKFPTRREIDGGSFWELDGQVLARMIARTKYATGEEVAKNFSIGGMFLELNGSVTTSCTDAKSISVVVGKSVIHGEKWSGQIPLKALSALSRMNNGPVRFAGTSGEARFESGGLSVSTALISGKYLPFAKLLEKKRTITAKVPTAALVSACKKVKLMTTAEETQAKFHFRAGRIDVEMGSGRGRCSTSVSGVAYEGEDLTMNLDPGAVMKTAQSSDSTSLTVRILDCSQPILLETDDGFSGLVATMDPKN